MKYNTYEPVTIKSTNENVIAIKRADGFYFSTDGRFFPESNVTNNNQPGNLAITKSLDPGRR